MLTDKFFNKSRFSVIKLTDQVEISPDKSFTLPLNIVDVLTFNNPTTVVATLQKTTGRDTTVLPTVVTITGSYIVSATPALLDWDGKTTLQLKLVINTTDIVVIPLVVKG